MLESVEPCNFTKKRLQDSCFPVNFCEIFKSSYFIEHLGTTSAGILFMLLLNFSVTWIQINKSSVSMAY